MDSFNPFANAWGDDPADPAPINAAGAVSSNDDPLGFKRAASSNGNHQGGNEDNTWGEQPVASTSASAYGHDRHSRGVQQDEASDWVTAPSTPRPAIFGNGDSDNQAWPGADVPQALPPLSEAIPSWGTSPPKHAATSIGRPRDDDNGNRNQHDDTPAWVANNDDDDADDEARMRQYRSDTPEYGANDQDGKDNADFGGFSEVGMDDLPNLNAGRSSTEDDTRHNRSNSDVDWGATNLPPSKWDEHLAGSEKPTWGPVDDTDGVASTSAEDGTDPWGASRAVQAREEEEEQEDRSEATQEEEEASTYRPSGLTGRDAAKLRDLRLAHGRQRSEVLDSKEAMDLERLQSELGIQIRNLDEEYASRPSPTSSTKSPTTPNASNTAAGTAQNAAPSRWSLWKGRKASETASATGVQVSESENATKADSAISPRASISSRAESVTNAVKTFVETQAPSVVRKSNDSAASTSEQKAQSTTGTFAQAPSRFWRFGAKPKEIPGTGSTSIVAGTAGDADLATASSSTTTPPVPPTNQLETNLDFGQLENFDSARPSSSNSHGNNSGTLSPSAYDDFGLSDRPKNGSNGLGIDDDLDNGDKKSWFWNRAPISPNARSIRRDKLTRSGNVVDYSAEQEEEQDIDKVFAVFADKPKPQPQAQVGGVARQTSLQSSMSGRSSANTRPASHDPFAHLNAVATSIRSPTSTDPFDPLDPLAELGQSSNITGRNFRDSPYGNTSPRFVQAMPAAPALAPPPSATTSTGIPNLSPHLSRPSSRTASHISQSARATPPPLLAPPPPLSSVQRRTSPQPSLLDDFGDLVIGPSTTSSASPVPTNTSTSPIPLPMTSQPVPKQASSNLLEDDFGDFEVAVPTPSSATVSGNHILQSQAKPSRASGPMKLAPASSAKQNADFFDLL